MLDLLVNSSMRAMSLMVTLLMSLMVAFMLSFMVSFSGLVMVRLTGSVRVGISMMLWLLVRRLRVVLELRAGGGRALLLDCAVRPGGAESLIGMSGMLMLSLLVLSPFMGLVMGSIMAFMLGLMVSLLVSIMVTFVVITMMGSVVGFLLVLIMVSLLMGLVPVGGSLLNVLTAMTVD